MRTTHIPESRWTARLLAAAAILTSAALLPANAKELPFQRPGELKKACEMAGGEFIPPGPQGVYGCLLQTGEGITCGGIGGSATTCSDGAPPRTQTGSNDAPAPALAVTVSSQAGGVRGYSGKTPSLLRK